MVTLASPLGVPFGRYVRYIMAYITTQAFKRAKDLQAGIIASEEEARTIPLGNTFNDFLRAIGINEKRHLDSRTIKLVKEQLERISALTIDVRKRFNTNEMKIQAKTLKVFSEIDWYYSHKQHIEQGQLFEPYIKLDLEFFHEIAQSGVPFDLNILKELSSPVAMDVYLWATYSVVTQSQYGGVRASWEQLKEIYGQQYANTPEGMRNFRKKFKNVLVQVSARWDSFTYQITNDGIYLPPQAPSIAPTNMHTEDIKIIKDSPLGKSLEK